MATCVIRIRKCFANPESFIDLLFFGSPLFCSATRSRLASWRSLFAAERSATRPAGHAERMAAIDSDVLGLGLTLINPA